MRAFFNDPELKQRTLNQLQSHLAAGDVIDVGTHWDSQNERLNKVYGRGPGKGSACGCMVHSEELSVWQKTLNIPRSIGSLVDRIAFVDREHEDKTEHLTQTWLRGVPVGADMARTAYAMQQWLLIDPTEGLITVTEDPAIVALIESLGALATRGMQGAPPTSNEWKVVRKAAVACADQHEEFSSKRELCEALETAAWDPAAFEDSLDTLYWTLMTPKCGEVAHASTDWTRADAEASHRDWVAAIAAAKAKYPEGWNRKIDEFRTPDDPASAPRRAEWQRVSMGYRAVHARIHHAALCRFTSMEA